jgi:5-methylcytosine-specific restriction endonuclease McrA
MPIKPENKSRYPKDWPLIRERIRERAGDKCENCGVVNYSYVNKFTRELCLQDEENTIRIVCTTAHLDHNPENCDDKNLAFLCQRCHNRYDMPHRIQTRKATKLKGQLAMPL